MRFWLSKPATVVAETPAGPVEARRVARRLEHIDVAAEAGGRVPGAHHGDGLERAPLRVLDAPPIVRVGSGSFTDTGDARDRRHHRRAAVVANRATVTWPDGATAPGPHYNDVRVTDVARVAARAAAIARFSGQATNCPALPPLAVNAANQQHRDSRSSRQTPELRLFSRSELHPGNGNAIAVTVTVKSQNALTTFPFFSDCLPTTLTSNRPPRSCCNDRQDLATHCGRRAARRP